jgi:hypothetical protein
LSFTGGLVDSAKTNSAALSLTSNQLTASITPTSSIVVGAVTSYKLLILNTFNIVPSSTNGGSLVVTIPSDLTLLSNVCTA